MRPKSTASPLASPHALSPTAKPSAREALLHRRSPPAPRLRSNWMVRFLAILSALIWMSRNDDKSRAAVDRIKTAALSAAKGLNRSQAKHAATSAARNVPMGRRKRDQAAGRRGRRLKKAAILDVKPKVSATSSLAAHTQCQKCFQPGHWTY
uniref:Uncharacterized protein n=1 Tax=Oryza rufipogon TaxID=4529 RepID=A0A0E0QBV3_ORYRU